MLHGREGEERKRHRHMWPVPATTVTAAPPPPHGPSPAPVPAADSFFKDGRKISVGDCALFQSGNSLPHIGIIRWLTSGKEDRVTLGVNWLYRPADVKLAKGALLEAAPNEVFYSFHKDETSAASLLHPCKVAFLRKGVELPSGISAFVCRRVYDIANKCLWWLTDQDYIDERQEEVDKLLDRTRLEMHAAVPSGGRSPKPLNGPASTQQLKPASDSTQNSTTSFASQGKGKKREQSDQGLEPIKRERSSKADDGESGHLRKESMIKAEVAKISDKGGLINLEAVEKLVHLMQVDRAEKKIDLAGRVMLADVIAATERPDCLGRFVNLRGVPILDDWLQEAHKGKIGDSSSPKESDKSVEEFLLAVLRALDKLPVNLHALQTCNVGKSVNHLRSHKNLEIQKKARSLVDTWKKRVEAEMKINDAKSGPNQAVSWPGKPGFSEVSHGGNRRSGSSEVAAKSSITQPASSKMGPVKLGHVDSVAKSTSASPGSLKVTPLLPASAGISSKDLNCKMAGSSGASDIPLTTIKEEKSSNSSQSQNNSQSYSSDHAKSVASASKEDAKSSTAGSMSAKTTGVSRTRKSSNGFLGSGVSGIQKEITASGKSVTLGRTTIADKVSQTRSMSERAPDMHPADHGNSHRLIVRLPNPGRSPARSASGGSFEDPSIVGSRSASPGASERLDHLDRKAKGKSDISWVNTSADVNTESWQSNDVKDGLAGLVEGDRSPTAVIDEERRSTDDIVKSMDASRGTCSSSGNDKGAFFAETKTGRRYEGSFSSINALIESCVKCSEASTSLSADDDIGMNLLASVAAGEIPKSEPGSPSSSPGRSSPAPEDPSAGNNSMLRSSHDDDVAQGHSKRDDSADADPGRQVNMVGPKQFMDESRQINTPPIDSISGDSKSSLPLPEQKSSGEQSEQIPSSGLDLCQTADLGLKSAPRPDVTATDGSVAGTTVLISKEICLQETRDECSEGGGANQIPEKRISGESTDGADIKPKVRTPSDEEKTTNYAGEKSADSSMSPDSVRGSTEGGCEIKQAASIKKIEEAVEELPSSQDRGRDRNNVPEAGATTTEQHPPVAANHVEALERGSLEAAAPSGSGNVLHSDVVGEPKPEQAEGMERSSHLEGTGDKERVEHTSLAPLTLDDRAGSGVGTVVVNQNNVDRLEEKSNRKDPSVSSPSEVSPTITSQENGRRMKFTLSKLSSVEADETEECASPAEGSSLANVVGSDITTKLDFDLNEGFAVDEGNQGELVTSTTSGCMSAVHLPSPLPFSVSPVSSGLPASITIAAAAKGPFVHPENLLRNKGDGEWKGSASNTSAFKPPDRRKSLEMPLSTTDITSDTTAGKQGRSPLDIDLNVPDERLLEDMASCSSVREAGSGSVGISNRGLGCTEMSGSSPAPIRSAGLDLDLNRADEGPENGQLSASTSQRFEVPLLPGRSSSSGGFPNGEVNVLRDFDLNNGPGFDEMGAEAAPHNQHAKANVQYLPPVSSIRMNNTELSSISSWFPPGNSYPAAAIPSFLHDREQSYPTVATVSSQRMLGSAAGGATFPGDIHRGPVLSSSPAMAFSPAASFPYAGFPFGPNFSLASTSFSGGSTAYMDSSSGGACFPTVSSQLVGAGGAVSSQYMRSYLINLPEGTTTSSGAENNRKLARHGLDLNAGPGTGDIEGRGERLPSASRQLPVANSQALVEEQARMYQAAAGALKRKEPEGGWDADRFSYRQTSWQ